MKIGIISGSGFYDFSGIAEQKEGASENRYGKVNYIEGTIGKHTVYFIARHGKGHQNLSNQVNSRANILALKELGVDCILATTITGILKPELKLAHIMIFDDIYFLENRLPNGETCTVFDQPGTKGQGHLIISKPFSNSLRSQVLLAVKELKLEYYDKGIYGYVNGPRLNTPIEIKALQQLGIDAISQTGAPEAILAAELEIPYQLIGFGVDYGNGVKSPPTLPEELTANMHKSKIMLQKLIIGLVKNIRESKFDQGFVYRFE